MHIRTYSYRIVHILIYSYILVHILTDSYIFVHILTYSYIFGWVVVVVVVSCGVVLASVVVVVGSGRAVACSEREREWKEGAVACRETLQSAAIFCSVAQSLSRPPPVAQSPSRSVHMAVITVDAKSLRQLCSSPTGMVMAVFAMISAFRRHPVLRQWAKSVAKQSFCKDLAVGAVVGAVVKVGQWAVNLAQFHQCHLKQQSEHLWAVAQTSQVCATRANVLEWRSCLSAVAEWHQCSLQGAYSLWQAGSGQYPACPANQWLILPQGQPLTAVDQYKADQSIGELWTVVQAVDHALGTVREFQLLIEADKATVDAKYQSEFQTLVDQYDQWKQLVRQYHGFSAGANLDSALAAVKDFQSTVNFNSPVFKQRAVKLIRKLHEDQ